VKHYGTLADTENEEAKNARWIESHTKPWYVTYRHLAPQPHIDR